MIDGIVIKEVDRHSDNRGFFSEIARDDDHLKRIGQVSIAKVYPGVVKAFHYHNKQEDVWYVISGNVQTVLYDLREKSQSYKETMTVYMGEDNPKVIIIPIGVAHGYKVLGEKPAEILYITSNTYDEKNPDELRLPWDSKEIGYDWECENR